VVASDGPRRTVVALPPTIDLDLAVELGVVFQGADVSGGITGHYRCAATLQRTLLETEVGARSETTTTAAPPTAAPPTAGPAPPAEAVSGTSRFTG
jgi:hypothetical protein